MAETNPLCAICGGKKSEHQGRVHAFTEKQGELLTQQSVDQQAAREKMQQMRPTPGSMMVIPPHPTQVDRLTETLLEKGILDRDDVLYIAMGIPKQISIDPDRVYASNIGDSSLKTTGFADPARMMPPGASAMEKVVPTEDVELPKDKHSHREDEDCSPDYCPAHPEFVRPI